VRATGTVVSLSKANNPKLVTTHEYARQTCKKSIIVSGNNSEREPNYGRGCGGPRGVKRLRQAGIVGVRKQREKGKSN